MREGESKREERKYTRGERGRDSVRM